MYALTPGQCLTLLSLLRVSSSTTRSHSACPSDAYAVKRSLAPRPCAFAPASSHPDRHSLSCRRRCSTAGEALTELGRTGGPDFLATRRTCRRSGSFKAIIHWVLLALIGGAASLLCVRVSSRCESSMPLLALGKCSGIHTLTVRSEAERVRGRAPRSQKQAAYRLARSFRRGDSAPAQRRPHPGAARSSGGDRPHPDRRPRARQLEPQLRHPPAAGGSACGRASARYAVLADRLADEERSSPLRAQSVPSASGSRQTCLRQGGVTAKRASRAAAIGSSGTRWTRRPGVKRSTRGIPATLPAWLPPETSSSAGLRAPAVAAPGRRSPRRSAERPEAGVGAPVGRPRAVVVAVVGGGPLVDLALGADADLHRLPVVGVIARAAGDRHAAQGRRVGVVEPVLDVEVAGPRPRAVDAFGLRTLRPALPAIDDVDEGGHRQASVAAVHQARAPSPSAQVAVRQRRKSTGSARDPSSKKRRHVLAHQPPDLGPVGGDQPRPSPHHRTASRAEESATPPPAPGPPPAPAHPPQSAPRAAARQRQTAHPLDRRLPPLRTPHTSAKRLTARMSPPLLEGVSR